MQYVIHAREINTRIRFRIWSSIHKVYLTDEMAEVQMRAWLLEDRVLRAIREHNNAIDVEIWLAKEGGSTDVEDKEVSFKGPWKFVCPHGGNASCGKCLADKNPSPTP